MGRFARSWDLFKTSFSVIQQDKELLWMPVLSFLASVIAIGGVIGIGIFSGIFVSFIGSDGAVDTAMLGVMFLAYLVLAFVQVYFHAATVAGANERLAGGDPTVGSALRKANQHLGALFLWSLVVATVNVILQALSRAAGERGNIIGQIVVSIIGGAWNLATYFVVPILIFEDKNVGGGMKGSLQYFKKTWGETIVGDVGIGFAAGVVSFAIILVGGIMSFLLFSVFGPLGLIMLGVTIMALIVASIIFTVAGAVYKTGLYRYASTGHSGGPFEDQQLAAQWKVV